MSLKIDSRSLLQQVGSVYFEKKIVFESLVVRAIFRNDPYQVQRSWASRFKLLIPSQFIVIDIKVYEGWKSKVHKKYSGRRGGGFKTGARLGDAANGGNQKFLPLVKKLEIIRYPFSSSVFHPFSGPRNRDRSDGMHYISVIISYVSYVIF